MKTIKVFLNDDGSIRDFVQDIVINQYSFQDTLLNVYVPSKIIDLGTTTQETDTSTITYGTNVQMGLIYTNSNGSTKRGNGYLFSYVKSNVYVNNINYTLFERTMPKEFSLYSGENTYAINVVNTKTTTENDVSTTVITNLITSGNYTMYITKSENFGNETEETSDYESIQAQLNDLVKKVEAKQDKNDTDLTTTSKMVVGAINELDAEVLANTKQIEINTQNIALNKNDIDYLKENMCTGEWYIGTIESESSPEDTTLTTFVKESAGREPSNDDVIIYIQTIEGATDKSYKCFFTHNGWNKYEIPPLESASNSDKGIIKGTMLDNYKAIKLDISNGEVIGAYVSNNITNDEKTAVDLDIINGVKESTSYTDLAVFLANVSLTITNAFESGRAVNDQVAKKARKAEQDFNGNVITETYMTNVLGASKQFVKDYALPREFDDTFYISSEGYTDTIPTSTEPQFSVVSSSVGYYTLFDLEKAYTSDFELTKKNSISTTIYIQASIDCDVQLLLTNSARVSEDTDYVDLSTELSGALNLKANQITKVIFDSTFGLLDSELKMTNGSTIKQLLQVLTNTSSEITFDIYSNETYVSNFNLNTFTQITYASSGNLGEYNVIELKVDTTKTLSKQKISFVGTTSKTIEANTTIKLVFTDLLEYTDYLPTQFEYMNQIMIIDPLIENITINEATYSFENTIGVLDLNNVAWQVYGIGTSIGTPFTFASTIYKNGLIYFVDNITPKNVKAMSMSTTVLTGGTSDSLIIASQMPQGGTTSDINASGIQLSKDTIAFGVFEENKEFDNATNVDITSGKVNVNNADLYVDSKKVEPFAYGINTFTTENGKLTKMTIKSRDDGAVESVEVGADTSNSVDLTSAQTISGVKTFTSEIKTNQIANENDNAMVRFKETEGKNVFGGITYDCVLMGKSSRPFYSNNGSDFSGNEIALMSDVSASESSMQALINEKQDKLTAGDGITISNNVISASGGSSGGGIKLYKHTLKNDSTTLTCIALTPTPFTNDNIIDIMHGSILSAYVDMEFGPSMCILAYTDAQPYIRFHCYGGKNADTAKSQEIMYGESYTDTVTEL